MAKTVVGLFDSQDAAHDILRDLEAKGFRREEISIVANSRGFGGDPISLPEEQPRNTEAAAVADGAETGAIVGGVAGLLVGIGALAIPGIGAVLAAGPLAAALTGAGVGAMAGGLIGVLVHQGVPDADAQYYAEGVRSGGTLITVNANDDRAELAADIFHQHGAIEMDERGRSTRESSFKDGIGADRPGRNDQEDMAEPTTETGSPPWTGDSRTRARVQEGRLGASGTTLDNTDLSDLEE